MTVRTFTYFTVVGVLIFLAAGATAKALAGESVLTVLPSSDKSASIEMANTVPVRGAQFTVSGVTMTEVRTTPRTAGFIAKFNEANGMVMLLSTSEMTIPPGKGAIAEIICDKPAQASLSGTKIVYAE